MNKAWHQWGESTYFGEGIIEGWGGVGGALAAVSWYTAASSLEMYDTLE